MYIKEFQIRNIVVGSGAAGFQAAIRLRRNGETDVALVTENRMAGTSRNTGSDKQTYYKLSMAGGDPDSVLSMAQDLFSGQCVDGDLALCEAALSARCFYHLVESGVPFPCTEYGEYMGYQTDHDRGRRATSVGPYTSKIMTECLEKQAEALGIPVMDGFQMIRILCRKGRVYGILCLDRNKKDEPEYAVIWSRNVILATGGPAGIYHDSVYPASQLGSTGLALEAGAAGKNLTEWQFGLASMKPRWNVSGTYMQVLPRFVSTDENGGDEREFLLEYYDAPEEMMSDIFLKGYQWPFDVNKVFGGSSRIDLFVYEERVVRGRRVFLDFCDNAGNRPIDFARLSGEAYQYLKQAGALFGKPVERLRVMNEPAYQFYLEHGVNLEQERLEIAVCAQHNNGGLSTDSYWETGVKGLFAAGEVCGSHGVTRPGGSALNAGQAGAFRAAERIMLDRRAQPEFLEDEQPVREKLLEEAQEFIRMAGIEACGKAEEVISAGEAWIRAAKRMSRCGGMIRDKEELRSALKETDRELSQFPAWVEVPRLSQLPLFYHLRSMLMEQKAYLSAMLDYAEHGGGSRGSALYTDPAGTCPHEKLSARYCCVLDQGKNGGLIQEIQMNRNRDCLAVWRPVRPIPEVDYFFENQWRAYRERTGS